jgi:hypothetical protein
MCDISISGLFKSSSKAYCLEVASNIPRTYLAIFLRSTYTDIELQLVGLTLRWIQTVYKDPPAMNGWPDSASFKYPILVSSLTEWIQPGTLQQIVNDKGLHYEKNSPAIGGSFSSSWDSEGNFRCFLISRYYV